MLQISHLKKSFRLPEGGQLPILDIPDYRLAAGEQAALIGESGGGKTTLLHAIAGIVAIDSGSVVLDGIETTRLSEEGRDRVRAAKLGYVFQTFNLLPGSRRLEERSLGNDLWQRKHDRAGQGTARPGRTERSHAVQTGRTVGGQQQRVAVARWPTGPSCCWPTNRPPTSIPPISRRSST